MAGLVQGVDGRLYGNTYYGGSGQAGTIFSISTNGVFATIVDEVEGYFETPLTVGRDGYLYTTSSTGGTNRGGCIFRLMTNGVLNTIFSFDYSSTGWHANGLVQGKDGGLYGTCLYGGPHGDKGPYGATDGTLFKVTPDGQLAWLIPFDGTNGMWPSSGLIEGPDGNFYGSTGYGGGPPPSNWDGYSSWGAGCAFQVTPDGQLTVLNVYSYDTGNLGPTSPLIWDDGYFYGTRPGGALYRMTTNGTITCVTLFTGTNGVQPNGVIRARDGNFYGTAYDGGSKNDGTIFRITPDGQLSTVFEFRSLCCSPAGLYPDGLLFEANDGNLYGTCSDAGANGDGTIFRLVMPGPPLRIRKVNAGTVMSWPTNSLGYRLQCSDQVTGGTWTDCTNTPTLTNRNYEVPATSHNPRQFFRLAK